MKRRGFLKAFTGLGAAVIGGTVAKQIDAVDARTADKLAKAKALMDPIGAVPALDPDGTFDETYHDGVEEKWGKRIPQPRDECDIPNVFQRSDANWDEKREVYWHDFSAYEPNDMETAVGELKEGDDGFGYRVYKPMAGAHVMTMTFSFWTDEERVNVEFDDEIVYSRHLPYGAGLIEGRFAVEYVNRSANAGGALVRTDIKVKSMGTVTRNGERLEVR